MKIFLNIIFRRLPLLILFIGFGSLQAQQDPSNPRNISGGSRTYNSSVTGNITCPNTYEYVPSDYNFSDKTIKYPLIISLPGLSEMLQEGELTTAGALRMIEQNLYGNAGVHHRIERGEFSPTFTYESTPFKFIVVGVQCKKDAFDNTLNVPAQLDQVLTNYILNDKFKDKIDLNRIYMVGTSRGGGILWEFMEDATRAQKIAAIALMAGGTDIWDYTKPAYTSRFENVITNILNNPKMGVYATHNIRDQTVLMRVPEAFINRLNTDWPGRVGFKVYDIEGYTEHNVWIPALALNVTDYFGYNIYQWMLSYSLAAISALPVTLTSFDAVAKSNAVDLIWNTESESNSSHFVVERSSNGRDFKEIGKVNSSGNSTTTKNYQFTDNSPLSGNNYYRLKMVDLDATFKYSEVRRVSMNGSDLEFSFGPNPVINEASIRITGNQRTRLNLTVTDLMGRTLKSMSFSKSDIIFSQKINLAELPAGQYILSVKGDNVNYTQRILKR